MKTITRTVCWACKKGGEAGPLVKIGKYDYVHKTCGGKAPIIENASFVKETRLEARDIKMLREEAEKVKEENDKTK